jgi:arylsulfatase A-like enzyme
VILGMLSACGGAEPEEPLPVAGEWPVAVKRTEEGRRDYDRVVLVTIDTLRADHVSCYGYPRQTTPFLDSLAARGVRFSRAVAAASHTAPSHATMLTGLVPAVHGVLHNGQRLDAGALDLPGLFDASGFECAAFLNVQFLGGIAGSFGHVQVCKATKKQEAEDGADVVDAALSWLEEKRQTERFFMWVHLYDPHEWQLRMYQNEGHPGALWSGATPEGFLERLTELHGLPPPRPEKPYTVDWGKDRSVVDESLPAFLRAIDEYDELTLFADRQVERLHSGIEALGFPGRTLWVVTSDHGEGLASHATSGHGPRIYQEQLRVPLVLYASDGSLAPRVVDELVAHIDLMPTLAETLGLRVTGNSKLFEGHSLWPLARGESVPWSGRGIFSQRRPAKDSNESNPSELYALQTASAKLILQGPGTDEFFDLASDPKELVDLGPGYAGAAELRAALEERLRVYRSFSPAGPDEEVPEEWMQELRGLGYVR